MFVWVFVLFFALVMFCLSVTVELLDSLCNDVDCVWGGIKL